MFLSAWERNIFMRKGILTAFSAGIFCIVMSGCSLTEITGLPPEPQIKAAYSCEYTATAVVVPPDTGEKTEFCFGGRLDRLGMGFWENELTSPETLAGMKLTLTGDGVNASLGELNFDMDCADIPDAAPFMAIFTELDNAAICENELKSAPDGGWQLETKNGVLLFDGSGIPVMLTVNEPAVTVNFSRFEKKGEQTVSEETSISSETTTTESSQTTVTVPETTVSVHETTTTTHVTKETTVTTTTAEETTTTVPVTME